MAFKRFDTPIEDLLLIEPDFFSDSRGFFMESYNEKGFAEIGITIKFVQDNLSQSTAGTLRGLHFQKTPYSQGKLVFVPVGEVLDVVVDLRKKSSTYGQSFSVILSDENKRMLYVPPGFAHGFLVKSDKAIFSYKCTDFYNKSAEGGLLWNDPSLTIDWGISNPVLSDKDKNYPPFRDFQSPF